MHCVRTCLLQIQIVWTIPKHEAVHLVTIQKYFCTLIPEPLGKAHLVDGMQKHQSAADLGEVTISLVYRVSQKMSDSPIVKKHCIFQTFRDLGKLRAKKLFGQKEFNDRRDPPLYVSIFPTLPNLNTEVWHGARTLGNRCSPEESRTASSSPCLLYPSKKNMSCIQIVPQF